MLLAEREEARLKEDILRFKAEQREIKERMNSHENDLFHFTKKSEDLRSRMNWDQQVGSELNMILYQNNI